MKTTTHRRAVGWATLIVGLGCLAGGLAPTAARAQGTAFTYQGVLQDKTGPATGSYDFQFELWDQVIGGAQVGSTITEPAVAVSNGFFTAELDFGAGAFDGDPRYLLVKVRTAGGPFYSSLKPRMRITPSPYSVLAATVPDGTIGTVHIENGSIGAADLGADSVGASEIAANAVGSSEVDDNSLTAVDLAANSVTASEIAAGAVGSSEVADGSLLGRDLAPNTVGSAELDDAIALGADGVNGYLYVYSEAGGGHSINLSGGSTSGGRLWLFSNDGQNGIWMAGGSDDAGLMRLYNTDGQARIELDGDGAVASGTGHIRVAEPDGTYVVDLYGSAGGKVYVSDGDGTTAVLLSGTASSGGYQYLYNAAGEGTVRLDGDDGGAGLINVRNSAGNSRVTLVGADSDGGGWVAVAAADGSTTVELIGESSSSGGLVDVSDSGSALRVRLNGGSTGNGGEISIYDNDGTETVEILGAESSSTGGQILLRDAAGNTTIALDGEYNGDGRVTTDELEITGGSDLSEQFDVTPATGPVQPGMVVCIDPEDPGRLTVSSRAYDRTVAGVISGAGGVKPGMLMGQRGSVADGDHPVALSGRAYCLVDASQAPIQPGDLITTSDRPGFGMKVSDHARAQGAIIGKAMTPLEEGQGLVLLLVSLQ